MSLKQQGNGYFRQKNYHKAIECYTKYVQTDHQDNKNAYFNLSLCHSNINMIQEAIVDCSKAIEEDSEYAKAYYKRCKLYRSMENRQYEIFIDAAMCYKFTDEKEEKTREQLMAIMKEEKQKLKYKVHTSAIFQQYQKILALFKEVKLQDKQKTNQKPKTKQWQEWIEQWKHSKDKENDWNQIRDVALKTDYNYGLNLAYLYLNQEQDNQRRTQIKQKIIDLKKQKAINKIQSLQQQSLNQPMQEQKKQQEQSDQQNLFQSNSQQPQPIQTASIQTKSTTIQVIKTDKISKEVPPLNKNKVQQDRECSQEQINNRYEYYFGKLKSSRDIAKDVIDGIIQILQSQEIRSMKMSLLSRLKKKQSDINILTKSCNNKQRTLIQNLINQNKITMNFAFKQSRK